MPRDTGASLDCLRHSFFSLYFTTLAHIAVEVGILLWQIDTLLDGKVQHFWGNSQWVVTWLRTLTVLTVGIVFLWIYVLFHSLTWFDLMETAARHRLYVDLVWYAVLRTGLAVSTALIATLSARRKTPVYDVMMGTVWYSATSVVITILLLLIGYCVYNDAFCHRGQVDVTMVGGTTCRRQPLPDQLQTAYVQNENLEVDSLEDTGCTTPPCSPRRGALARMSGRF